MTDGPTKANNPPLTSGTTPKVSVAMVAYKHERFITQAIETVMMQETTFPYELVIGEDCSPDRTREIILGLQEKYPDRIRVLLREKNVGMMTNFVQTLQTCTGAYIALLEGDDYWTDPRKLQKQVDLLERHPEYSACFARTRVIVENSSPDEFCIPSAQTDKAAFTTEDLLAKNSIATASVMYRNVMQEIDFEPLAHLKMIDWPLHILVSLTGPVGYIPEEMAAYRLHAGGVWTGADAVPKLQATIEMYDALKTMLPVAYSGMVSERIVKTHQLAAIELLRSGRRYASLSYTLAALRRIPPAKCLQFGWYLKRSAILLLGCAGLAVGRVERLMET